MSPRRWPVANIQKARSLNRRSVAAGGVAGGWQRVEPRRGAEIVQSLGHGVECAGLELTFGGDELGLQIVGEWHRRIEARVLAGEPGLGVEVRAESGVPSDAQVLGRDVVQPVDTFLILDAELAIVERLEDAVVQIAGVVACSVSYTKSEGTLATAVAASAKRPWFSNARARPTEAREWIGSPGAMLGWASAALNRAMAVSNTWTVVGADRRRSRRSQSG